MDPEVIAKLLAPVGVNSQRLAALTPRETQVLSEMAAGRSNAAIQQKLFLSESAVGKHIASIFGKLGLAASDDDNRRVLAVLAYLNA
jgi:DNA-binding NarL/FixJ family response regulator